MAVKGDQGVRHQGLRYQGIKVTMVTGFLGAGKTTLIRHLLEQVPNHERWAVLVNEFGDIGLDSAFYSNSDVAIKEVPGGCVCCTTSAAFQQGLNTLIREQNPDRIFIEPSGLGHPKQIVQKLRSQIYQDVLLLTGVLCVLDARTLRDERYTNHEIYNDQIESANGIVFSHVDLYKTEDINVLESRFGALDLENDHVKGQQPKLFYTNPMSFSLDALDIALKETAFNKPALKQSVVSELSHDGHHAHSHSHCHGNDENAQDHSHDAHHSHDDGEKNAVFHYRKQQDSMQVVGWRWPLDKRFSINELESSIAKMASIEGIYRIKGVFSVGNNQTGSNEAAFVNVSRGEVSLTFSTWQEDSRMEVIGDITHDWISKLIEPV
ncbi:CobW family GTP-binding protein [Marinomonas sp.]|nr:CobW family GTP-binding protein [Marinomonas sp.]MDB4836931.1 CobW family GTP-binding protein [Marinomonas sp.]